SMIENYIQSFSVEDKKIIGSKAALYRWLKRFKDTNDKRSLSSNNKFKKKYYKTNTIIVSMIEDMLKDEEKLALKTTTRDKWIKLKLKVDEYNDTRTESYEIIKLCSFTTLYR